MVHREINIIIIHSNLSFKDTWNKIIRKRFFPFETKFHRPIFLFFAKHGSKVSFPREEEPNDHCFSVPLASRNPRSTTRIIQHRQRTFREAVWVKDRSVGGRRGARWKEGSGRRRRRRNRKPTALPSTTLRDSLVPRSTISRQHNSSPLVHSPQPGRNINPHPPR